MHTTLEEHGFTILSGVVEASERESLAASLGPTRIAGRRGLLDEPEIAKWARSPRVTELIRQYFAGEPLPVRALYFYKSPESNWFVSWHQDVTITVRHRRDVPGFGPWSIKEGVQHVQPPIEVLEQMLTVRLHLDDTDEANGALKVLPGSHKFGRLSPEQIAQVREQRREVDCFAPAGSVMLMRPLLLHASSRVATNRPRRVVHIEYAAAKLPGGLEWHDGARH